MTPGTEAAWLDTLIDQLSAALDEYAVVGQPVGDLLRGQLDGLVGDLRMRRDMHRRAHARSTNVIAMPPPRRRPTLARPGPECA